MTRILTLLLLTILSVSTATATIIPVDSCTGDYNDDSIRDLIRDNPTTHNCLDVVCVAITNAGIPVRVSDGTQSASSSPELRGHQSFLLTESATELRQLQGLCRTPAFYEPYCSYRGDWNVRMGIVRHYMKADEKTALKTWNDAHFGPITEIGVDYEVVSKDLGPGYTCEDTLPPQLLLSEDRFDLNTGSRTINMVFNDNEHEYVTENANTISLLMDLDLEETDNPDDTMLESCWYAITQSTTVPAPGVRVTVDCQGAHTFPVEVELEPDTISGLYLWMNATDDAGNSAQTSYELDDYYEALGDQGYCPRPNECLISAGNSGHGDGTDLATNTFTNYLGGGRVPACVLPGNSAGNIYCSNNGRYERSQALFEYGIAELGTSRGVVYCGKAQDLTPLEGAETRCTGLSRNECTLSCVVSIDGPNDAWQQASALFASNNFLSPINDEPHLNIPLAFSRGLEHVEDSGRRYLSAEDCQVGEQSFSCMRNTQYSPHISDDSTALANTVRVRYHNTTGIGSISQIRQLQVPTPNRIQTGHEALEERSEILTSRLNTYLRDIALDTYENVPEYSAQRLAETTRVAAYRSAGTKRILGISTNVHEFRYKMPNPRDPPAGSLFVVAVLYENFDSNALDYIDQAKDDISIIRATPIRTIRTPVSGSSDDSNYLLFVATRNEESAREMIERLVVRVRLE